MWRTRISPTTFVAVWTGGQMAGWILAMTLYLILEDVLIGRRLAEALLTALVPGMVSAVVQVLLVERGLKQPMRGWLPVSLLGWLVSALGYMALYESNDLSVRVVALFVPAAIIQTLWLWPRVRAAWLWGAAGIASALVFALPLEWASGSNASAYLILALAGALQSIITATTMVLLQHQRRDIRAKRDARAGTTSQALRLADDADETAPRHDVSEASESLHIK